jgi:hypothetical protein
LHQLKDEECSSKISAPSRLTLKPPLAAYFAVALDLALDVNGLFQLEDGVDTFTDAMLKETR